MSANWLDKTISFIAPTAAAKRARARLVEQHINSFLSKRAYDGATAGRTAADCDVEFGGAAYQSSGLPGVGDFDVSDQARQFLFSV